MKTTLLLSAIAMAFCTAAHAQKTRVPGCDDLVWSAAVLEANPDMRLACQGVYSRGGTLFAKLTIEVVRVTGNRLTFKPLHTDGSSGDLRSIALPNNFQARVAGETLRAKDLLPGQKLNVYMPENRFAMTLGADGEMLDIE